MGVGLNHRTKAMKAILLCLWDDAKKTKKREQQFSPQLNKVMGSFPDWLERPSDSTYWMTGKPSSGKSTLMKSILAQPQLQSYLEKWAGGLPLVVVTFYAWHAGFTLQKSFSGLKRTLLVQALHSHPRLLTIVVPRRWAVVQILRGNTTFPLWENWEVDESFDALLSESGKSLRLVIFIDGLDEFDVDAN
ncbi:hypothetical protein B0T26DRAFT_777462 [Lasiosphaeria miniovina]|uniref:Nephrocystin 3-like N-terminal domain-containing protein n=1 Tax=Lasiosphaeria miniovina TaxID=1954250 RepID=A0AA40DWC8_9PEZI|nr:uncharacterized protein B0T26DRAFT_777462 [Lasiosphaeria miniovina]KAK0718055.1 hypothetical protein B0T26DRAFT_777462 [Lasiosphaeria miniovina]